jgi:hypothetical protein
MDVTNWPEAPQDEQPKALYIAEALSTDEVTQLNARGWEVIDVRTMPNKTDADKWASVKATLEGVRARSITGMTKIDLEALKLEAASVGPKMAGSGVVQTRLDKADLDLILSFQNRRAFDGTFSAHDDFLERVEKHVSKRRAK